MEIVNVLRFAVENNASDIHIQADAPPMLRIAGQIRSVEAPPLSDAEIHRFVASIASGAGYEEIGAALA